MKSIKKTMLTALVLLLVLALAPCALAKTEVHDDGLDFTQGDFLAVDAPDSEGWKWAPATKTLTLTDLRVDTDDGCGIYLPAGSTIVLNGKNSVKVVTDSTEDTFGIDCEGDLTIMGDGALTVTVRSSKGAVCGIGSQGALKLATAKKAINIDVRSDVKTAYAVYAVGDINSTCAALSIKATSKIADAAGLCTDGSVTIAGGKHSISANGAVDTGAIWAGKDIAVAANKFTVAITNKSSTAIDRITCYGLYSGGALSVTGGVNKITVNAKAQYSAGLLAYGNISIAGGTNTIKANASVKSTSAAAVQSFSGDISFSGGKTTLAASECAIASDKGDAKITFTGVRPSGGTVMTVIYADGANSVTVLADKKGAPAMTSDGMLTGVMKKVTIK